jgi:transposase InsO family protein
MQIRMQKAEMLAAGAMAAFVRAAESIDFTGQSRQEIYGYVEGVLVQQEFLGKSKGERGVIRAFLAKVTGRSQAQLTRLIARFRKTGAVRLERPRRHGFAVKYTEGDVALLVEVDRAHERLSGPATRRILLREFQHFGRQAFRRLAEISSSHLYNLRRSAAYQKRAVHFEHTRPAKVSIAERRRPAPDGQPGWIRVNTVHQGDWDGAKGVYHINAVDEVTQWEVVGCTEKISERLLKPVLEAMLHQFPFRIRGFHADNGSEYINHTVAKLLNKLVIEFTKSRPNKSEDNALVEGKNGAVIRKLIGYGHIPSQHAERLQKFYTAHLNPYLNYHRPCGFATLSYNARGKRKRTYRHQDYATPYEKLKSLPAAARCLKPGLSFELLDRFADARSDTECARRMRQAKSRLLASVKVESPLPPRD